MTVATLIIGGTYRTGTTSVFTYLSDHPQVCGSRIKETAFFIRDYTGDRVRDEAVFDDYFAHCSDTVQVRVEGSAGYLANAGLVAARMKELLGAPRLLFILRPPAERLYSYFNYLVGQLRLPASLSFDEYLDVAFEYDAGSIPAAAVPFSLEYAEALRHGRYSEYLETFLAVFDAGLIKVMLFADLHRDAMAFMRELAGFAGIDPDFYTHYPFGRINATFSSKNALLHRFALLANTRLEPFLRQRRALKAPMVKLYKKLNLAREGYSPMSPVARRRLSEYYADEIGRLEGMLGRRLPENWQR